MSELPSFWEVLRYTFLFGAGIAGSFVAFIVGFAVIGGPAFAAYKYLELKYGKKEPTP